MASSPLLAACDSSVDSTSINKTSEEAAVETTVSSPGKSTSDIVNHSPEENAEEKVQIQFLCTSDIQGKYLPYDYARDAESLSGSMAQVYSAVKENVMKNMILIDVGDSIQDNFANIYIKEPNHPFAQAVKKMGYDIWCLGNHDFNYGIKVTDRKSRAIMIKDYKPDKEITELLDWSDEMAKKEAHTVIGQLSGGPLVPENESSGSSKSP